MKIDEFLKNEKNLDLAAKCKDIGEFKKFIDKNDVFYFTEQQLKKAWNYVMACSPSQDQSLEDDALEVVAGGRIGELELGGMAVMTYGCFPSKNMPSENSKPRKNNRFEEYDQGEISTVNDVSPYISF